MKHRSLVILLAFGTLLSPKAQGQGDAWLPVEPMPTARESVAACTVEGKIYAIGGFPGQSARGIKTNERYDPAANSWTVMAPMPTGRRMPVTGVVDGIIYVIGGTNGGQVFRLVEAYNPTTNSWTTRTPMQVARALPGAAAANGKIHVMGGAIVR